MNIKISTLTVIFALLIMSCGESKNEVDEATDMIESASDEASEELSEAMDESNEESNEEASDNNTSGSSSDCEQFCVEYEAFADSYIKVLKKYKSNPSDMSILTEYSAMMSQASTMQNESPDCAGDVKTAARLSAIAMKMAKAAM